MWKNDEDLKNVLKEGKWKGKNENEEKDEKEGKRGGGDATLEGKNEDWKSWRIRKKNYENMMKDLNKENGKVKRKRWKRGEKKWKGRDSRGKIMKGKLKVKEKLWKTEELFKDNTERNERKRKKRRGKKKKKRERGEKIKGKTMKGKMKGKENKKYIYQQNEN